jgi:DNA-binding CsgD family transcriptional regulator
LPRAKNLLMNSSDLSIFEQSFISYLKLWQGIECSTDQEVLDFAKSLRGNKVIGIGPEMVYLLEYQKQKYLYFSSNIHNNLAITQEYLKKEGIKAILARFHPDDLEIHLSFTLPKFRAYIKDVPGHELPNTKFAFNYRLQQPDGQYLQFLQQFIVLKKDCNGVPIYEYGTISDISHVKTDNRIFFRVTLFKEGQGFINRLEAHYPFKSQAILSKRELEIVSLMRSGRDSKQIASTLNISIETVQTHKRNMYAKTSTQGQFELVEYARKNGLL